MTTSRSVRTIVLAEKFTVSHMALPQGEGLPISRVPIRPSASKANWRWKPDTRLPGPGPLGRVHTMPGFTDEQMYCSAAWRLRKRPARPEADEQVHEVR